MNMIFGMKTHNRGLMPFSIVSMAFKIWPLAAKNGFCYGKIRRLKAARNIMQYHISLRFGRTAYRGDLFRYRALDAQIGYPGIR